MVATAIVETRGLTKRYGDVRGIDDVTFSIREGEVFGFLGPNGAGKTTTMRILLDLLRPTSGSALIFGQDARDASTAIHARVGYLPGEPGDPGRLTVAEQLHHSANLRGGIEWSRVESLASRFSLDLMRPVRALSRGNKQKVALVEAFMHDPDLLILDEPTSGLDPLMQQEFKGLVRETAQRGKTIFLSSHILPEVEALCDRVAIIKEGRLLVVEEMAAIRTRAVRRVEVTFTGPATAALFQNIAGVHDVTVEGSRATFRIEGPTGPLVKAMAGTDVVDLVTQEPDLDELFLALYNGREAP